MKQVSYSAQDTLLKEHIPEPFTFNYESVEISVNPVLSLQDRKNFTDIIWSMVSSGGEYLPVLLSPALRIAALYVYTNLKIDLSNIDRTYLLAQYSKINATLVDELCNRGYGADYLELERAAKEYVQFKAQESVALQAAVIADSRKSALDSLVETVLENLNTVLEKFSADNADVSAKSVIEAISKMGQLNDENKLVDNIIKAKFGRDEVADEHRGESAETSDDNSSGS